MRRLLRICGILSWILATPMGAAAETIRIAIGTQDTTINCAAGGLLIRELDLLRRHLPHDGKYKDATYDIQWKNFSSGAPITNEMVAGKLDIGLMADFPGALNGVAFKKAGKSSRFITVLSGSIRGSGNGVVVPIASPAQSLAELKGKTISVPFASTAHGMLLRAVADLGWDPARDVKIIAQAPEVAGSALQSGQIDAHADFVPFAELFPARGFARKIFDGAQAGVPTFHGALVDSDYAEKYPELVVAYLRAIIDANRLLADEPEKYSELIAKATGIDAPVVYLFHGPLGLQTRDLTWKKEYRQDLATSIETLKLLKRADTGLDLETFIDDRFIRAAFKASGLDYDTELAHYASSTSEPMTEASLSAELWLEGEPKVHRYASPDAAFAALTQFETQGKKIRAAYAQDRSNGIKIFANRGWYVAASSGRLDAFFSKAAAESFAAKSGGKVQDFDAILQSKPSPTRRPG
ncbi:ABC transporter substrate-binding protein [Methylocystis sp. Sn-Cys]|uniref:ABC transporter substrate-binding protein n=1 Tax=Methylocystis sp. Sn-Cys TaxID=1701263 RepID=UPI001924520C|nr:ABC transporter substrate-binding protein [Methylocystis sp. Sn-Cys]MBL1257864.1 ABC transporter substrate-binding protein [Methylocystis sp. Sn-Cys]